MTQLKEMMQSKDQKMMEQIVKELDKRIEIYGSGANEENKKKLAQGLMLDIAAQSLDLHAPMIFGFTVCFARPDALQGTLIDSFYKFKPTLLFGVPRVWEKIMV